MKIKLHPVGGGAQRMAAGIASAFAPFVAFARAQLLAKSAPPGDQEDFLATLDTGDPGEMAEGFLQCFARWLEALLSRWRSSVARRRSDRAVRERWARRLAAESLAEEVLPQVFSPEGCEHLEWATAGASLCTGHPEAGR